MSRFIMVLIAALALSACATNKPPQMGADGKPLPRVYRISSSQSAKVQYGMLDSINVLREASGAAPLELNPLLTAAAETHSRDMSAQNRPWHFGSDGSSPIDRARRAGFTGQMRGENISETYETESQTLAAWMSQENTRNVVLDKNATQLGFAWFQEPGGKLWWTMLTGS